MIEEMVQVLHLLIGLFILLGVGVGFLSLISPGCANLSGLEKGALGVGLGAFLITQWMLILGLLGISFTLIAVVGPPAALAWSPLLSRKFRQRTTTPATPRQLKNANPLHPWEWLFLGLLFALFLYATLRAALYPVWAWDAYATWGFKAKVFYLNRGVAFQGFEAHNYYPNLVPLLLTYLYLWLGQVNDHLVKLIFPLFGAALLTLLYGLLLRIGLNRTRALGLTAFFALNGVTFIVHLYIAYADLVLAYYTLGAAGLAYLWLGGRGPHGALVLSAAMCAGLAWAKFEGPPLAATIVVALALTLLRLRPPNLGRRIVSLAWPVAGILLGYLPWRLFMRLHRLETGSDHILGFYANQLWQALPALLKGLFLPKAFGLLWPAALLSLAWLLKKPCSPDMPGKGEACLAPAHRGLFRTRPLLATPVLFLALFLGGNLLAILLGYAVAPTSAAEFPFYVRATLDRLLLHITPVAALLVGEGLKAVEAEHKA